MTAFRKMLGMPGMLQSIPKIFSKIADPKIFAKLPDISIADHLMAGLAVFGLKCPSLLDYDKKRTHEIAQNLRDLYLVSKPPSDTYLRERLDFSGKIACCHCCKKELSNGNTTYYHQMFAACVVHPDKRNVIPLCPKPILNQDGSTKNDCERNACKRFLENFRREHPHLKAILTGDGLTSNAPYIRMVEEFGLKYILGAKPGDHGFLFETLESSEHTIYHEIRTDDGDYHQFRFLNRVSLNKSNPDVVVNVLEYRQTNHKGKETNFSWVTNIELTHTNVFTIMRGGRARWKIENETFNTLKNLGYKFEHNFDHGKVLLHLKKSRPTSLESQNTQSCKRQPSSLTILILQPLNSQLEKLVFLKVLPEKMQRTNLHW